jgi:hypothetical protein
MLKRLLVLVFFGVWLTGCTPDQAIDGRVKEAAIDHPNCDFSITSSPEEATRFTNQGWKTYAIEEPYHAMWLCVVTPVPVPTVSVKP